MAKKVKVKNTKQKKTLKKALDTGLNLFEKAKGSGAKVYKATGSGKKKKKSLMWYVKERARLKAKRAYNKEKMRF